MIRKIVVALSLMVAGGLISLGVVLMAQNMMTGHGKYISKAEIMKGLDESKAAIAGGKTVQIVPGLVVRRRLSGANDASIHSAATDGADVTEVMEVIDGSGTFTTGGTWIEKADLPYKKRDRTKGITGGESHEVKPGDFVVIPRGTPHWFSKINDHVIIVETRFPGDITMGKK